MTLCIVGPGAVWTVGLPRHRPLLQVPGGAQHRSVTSTGNSSERSLRLRGHQVPRQKPAQYGSQASLRENAASYSQFAIQTKQLKLLYLSRRFLAVAQFVFVCSPFFVLHMYMEHFFLGCELNEK